jgi:CspA family cold shock protein
LQNLVKQWFKDKDFGFLDNGSGSDIMVRKSDLSNCQFLKPGVMVEFECHINKQSLNKNQSDKAPFRFGVMK